MAWLDGLDIPFVHQTDSGFFAYGSDTLTDTSTPGRSRAERLWAHPGLQPVALLGEQQSSPIAAYRWQHTDQALSEQLEIEGEGHPATMGAGHAAVRFSNPTTGGDVMPTIRAEFHRLRAGAVSEPQREVGSSVWQVFAGSGSVWLGGTEHCLERGDLAIEIGASDVGALLAAGDWRAQAGAADGPQHRIADLSYAPVVPRPGKIICVGLNYRSHIIEMGRDLPEYPTLFAKYPEALIGAFDPLTLPAESDQVDWEVELAVVVGRRVRHAGAAAASEAIAGYSIINDVTMRDWQYRTPEWLQGKTFEATTPFGPHLVTPDEIAPDAKISCLVDGEVVQDSTIADLLFGPVDLVRYISTILPLDP